MARKMAQFGQIIVSHAGTSPSLIVAVEQLCPRLCEAVVALEASHIALGTWAIGGWMWGGTEESDAISTIHAALDNGIYVIDTAPVYGFGRGKALESGRREGAIIATKVGLDWGSGKILRSSTRRASEWSSRIRSAASRPM
jgi:aryl-alcohol dehydrogenase-like predicted oxidoreductase